MRFRGGHAYVADELVVVAEDDVVFLEAGNVYHDSEPGLDDIVRQGFGGVYCIETGGPTPGIGCAGRGIIATFNLLDDLKIFDKYEPDAVLYDVLGDVVCGGFAAPIREGYAEDILIVTSGEKMALYAANNIKTAVDNFADRGYAKVRGIVFNHRNVENEEEKVNAFAKEAGIPVIGEIPRSREIIDFEDRGMTVIEGDPDSEISARFFGLADMLDKEIMKSGDAKLREEDDLMELVTERGYDTVIGDPLFRRALPGWKGNYFSLPHFAVSGSLHAAENEEDYWRNAGELI